MKSSTQKRGRPAGRSRTAKRVVANLDAERLRQFEELRRHISGTDSAVIGTCIAFHHAHMKKEWPNDFS